MYKFLLLSFAIFCGLQAEIKIGYTTMPDPRTNQDSIFEWILISQNANDKDCESNEIKTTFQFKNLNDNPERVKLKRHYCSPPNGFDNETL